MFTMSPKPTEFESEAILLALKELLRERRIGYQAIADSMKISLPTVKRMLNKTNLPLDRLLAICLMAKIDAEEVLARAKKNARDIR